MQPISIRTTQNKFIVSIDKQWIDAESLKQLIEKITQKILAENENENITLPLLHTSRFQLAQRFKGAAKSDYITSKYDVYEHL